MNSEEAAATQNPYAAPIADLAIAPDASDIQVFERFSAWAVFGLMVVTIWFYGYYWLYTRAKTLNTVVEDKISDSFISITIWGSVTMSAIGLVFPSLIIIGFEFGATSPMFELVRSLLGFVFAIMAIVLAFKMKSRLNIVTGSEQGDKTFCGSVGTFFLSAIYLQHKINRSIDLAETTAA